MYIDRIKTGELNSLLGIKIHKKNEEEVVERIVVFFKNKILELSQTISGLNLLEESSNFIHFQNGKVVYVSDEKITFYQTEILCFLNPLWYNSEKKLSTKKSDMIDYILNYLYHNKKENIFLPYQMVKIFTYGIQTTYKSSFPHCFVNQNKISTKTGNLKYTYAKKILSYYFLEEAFEEFKKECLIAYKEEQEKMFNYHFKPNYLKNLTNSSTYNEIIKHFKRDFDLSDLDEILTLSFLRGSNYNSRSKLQDMLSNKYILENILSIPCLK